jgi:hypothetical protein
MYLIGRRKKRAWLTNKLKNMLLYGIIFPQSLGLAFSLITWRSETIIMHLEIRQKCNF